MTGSAQSASHRTIACCFCSGPVPLETSNTDEHGRAVHEECYVRNTISRFRKGQRSPENGFAGITSRFYHSLRVTG